MTLSVVPDLTDEPAKRPEELPAFEGEKVDALRARLVSGTNLDVGEDPHRLDDTVKLLVSGRVTRVDHIVEEKSGKLVRVETFKIVDAVEVDWDALSKLIDD